MSQEAQAYIAHNRRPLILALDTSSQLTSLALREGERIVANFGAHLDDNRSARLWELTDFLLSAVGKKIEMVDVYAVCIGPGAFTGLRVGMAAIKGFAAATGKPTVGVTSLAALAALAYPAERVCVLSNAYRGEVYTQMFSFNEQGLPQALSQPLACPIEEALRLIDKTAEVVFTGDGALSHADVIMRFQQTAEDAVASPLSGATSWRINSGSGFLAETIARLAAQHYANGAAVQAAALEACYVRSADVKIKQQV
ncbi:MAG: tRNA (adenosine(37)-N6)-threonylcarbamoyltransferase complex dimerization subunit type 1 TsaB [Acidobacteria bacterium]|nr:tRNA (adenosine(37)-N6)-threonylcarbamoyltransferase complex dimerization subunit type 1 TsaB [Acidobacteriota bacterium]